MPERNPTPRAAGQGLEKEEVAPQAGLVDAQVLGLAVDAVKQQCVAAATPAGTVLQEAGKQAVGLLQIEAGAVRLAFGLQQLGDLDQAAGGNGAGGAVPGLARVGREAQI